jgi:carboxylate-amine ligase
VGARLAVHRFVAELEEDLRAHDEWEEVSGLVRQLFVRGTSAFRQRCTWLQTGDTRAVAEQVVREGLVTVP